MRATSTPPVAEPINLPGTIDRTELRKEMLKSFKTSFVSDWQHIRQYAESETERLSLLLLQIHKLLAEEETITVNII